MVILIHNRNKVKFYNVVSLRGVGYPALWPLKNCADFTFKLIDGVLSGSFVSLTQAISLIYSEYVHSLGN